MPFLARMWSSYSESGFRSTNVLLASLCRDAAK